MKMQISNSAYHENTPQGTVVPAPPPSGSLSITDMLRLQSG